MEKSLYYSRKVAMQKSSKTITNIVFTKNRPLQLHGYLESLYRFFPAAAIETVILYKPERFDVEYHFCFSYFPDCRIVREVDFHSDLLKIINEAETSYIMFGIDDVVYFDTVSLSTIETAFRTLGKELFGFSLRLDVRQMPDDERSGNLTAQRKDEQPFYTLSWPDGQSPSTRYPFELCATVYRAETVKQLVAETMKGGAAIHTLFAPSSGLVRTIGRIYSRRKLLKLFGYFFNLKAVLSDNYCI